MEKFQLELSGLTFTLDVRNYVKCKDYQDSCENWCDVNLDIKSEFMHYVITNDEMLMCCEIDTLIVELTKFLNGEETRYPEWETLEPNLNFIFQPSIFHISLCLNCS